MNSAQDPDERCADPSRERTGREMNALHFACSPRCLPARQSLWLECNHKCTKHNENFRKASRLPARRVCDGRREILAAIMVAVAAAKTVGFLPARRVRRR